MSSLSEQAKEINEKGLFWGIITVLFFTISMFFMFWSIFKGGAIVQTIIALSAGIITVITGLIFIYYLYKKSNFYDNYRNYLDQGMPHILKED
jgi:hypothetical protein